LARTLIGKLASFPESMPIIAAPLAEAFVAGIDDGGLSVDLLRVGGNTNRGSGPDDCA